MVTLITNRSYLDSRQADGLRKSLADEFQRIWIVDLMSDVRKNPKISGSKYNIFGIQTGVAIIFLVRDPSLEGCDIRYMALDDFLPAEDKRRWLAAHTLERLAKAGELTRLEPNARGDWLNQPEHDWSRWLPVASKDGKAGKTDEVIFRLLSLGVVTARDEWVYGKSKAEVSRKVRYLIDAYHRELNGGELARIKWTRAVKRDLAKQRRYRYDGGKIIESLYRPFSKRWLYYDAQLNEMRYQLGSLYVGPKNPTIAFLGVSSANPLALMAVNTVFDYCFLKMGNGGTQSLPIWFFDHDAERQDNITDWALHQFQDRYVDPAITRRDIFDYVYAVLHDPDYREKYALNLKVEFPRPPFIPISIGGRTGGSGWWHCTSITPSSRATPWSAGITCRAFERNNPPCRHSRQGAIRRKP